MDEIDERGIPFTAPMAVPRPILGVTPEIEESLRRSGLRAREKVLKELYPDIAWMFNESWESKT
jgi:hypothetical protein